MTLNLLRNGLPDLGIDLEGVNNIKITEEGCIYCRSCCHISDKEIAWEERMWFKASFQNFVFLEEEKKYLLGLTFMKVKSMHQGINHRWPN